MRLIFLPSIFFFYIKDRDLVCSITQHVLVNAGRIETEVSSLESAGKPLTCILLRFSTQLKIALLVEQCFNNMVIMAAQCCGTNSVVHYCVKQCCSALIKQQQVVHSCWNRRKQY